MSDYAPRLVDAWPGRAPVKTVPRSVSAPLTSAATYRFARECDQQPVASAHLRDGTAALSAELAAELRVWWQARARTAGIEDPATLEAGLDFVSLAGEPDDPSKLRGLADEACAEIAGRSGYALGERYTARLSAAERVEHGRHYTPELLAGELWSELAAIDPELAGSGTTQDPAAGAGALLLPPLRAAAVEALAAAERGEQTAAEALAAVTARFRGRDLDERAVALGNVILAAELLPLWSRIPPGRRPVLPQLLRTGDGLAPAPPAQVTVLNPPYGRVRLDEAGRRRWGHVLSGHANRYQLFLASAVAQTAPGGLIGAVIPTSFTGGNYFRRLRAWLTTQAPLARLVFVADRSGVFAGVLQETCLAVFRRERQVRTVRCARLSANGVVERQDLGESPAPIPRRPSPTQAATALTDTNGHSRKVGSAAGVASVDLAELPWPLPRIARDASLVRRSSELPERLASYRWRASTGPLVWNRHKSQLYAEPGQGRVPILWAADLEEGMVRRNASRDSQRFFAARDRDSFMVLREPGVLVQRTTAPEQPRRLLAAVLDEATIAAWGGGVVVENHVNVLRCSDPQSPLSARVLAALLDSQALDRLYRCLTGSVAVSAYELHALPLPGPRALRRWAELDPKEMSEAIENYYRR